MLFSHTTSPQGRRTFLATATATAASALAADNLFGSPLFSGIIDTHTHFYDPSRAEGVPWPSKEDAGLYRSVLPDEFVKLTEHLGVQGTVVVEASPWVEDNQWLIDLADTNTSIVGVIGNLPVGTGDFGALLEDSAHRIYRGVRINGDAIARGLDSELFVSDLLRFVEYELTVDVNHGAMPLVAINRLAARIPDLHVVIDHMGGTRMVGRDPNKDWVEQIRLVARHKNVFMKVSALAESATSGFENALLMRHITSRGWILSGMHSVKIVSCSEAIGRFPIEPGVTKIFSPSSMILSPPNTRRRVNNFSRQ